MPQMNKGGKFIFGESVIRPDGLVQLPPQSVEEYRIASEGKVYLFTGSKVTGGFCVTRRGLLLPSKLGHILTEIPALLNYGAPEGRFGRKSSKCNTFVKEDLSRRSPTKAFSGSGVDQRHDRVYVLL